LSNKPNVHNRKIEIQKLIKQWGKLNGKEAIQE